MSERKHVRELTVLTGGIAPLRDAFDADADKTRLLLLLSPT